MEKKKPTPVVGFDRWTQRLLTGQSLKILNFLTLDGMPDYFLPAPICGGYLRTKLLDSIQSFVGGKCYKSAVGNASLIIYDGE